MEEGPHLFRFKSWVPLDNEIMIGVVRFRHSSKRHSCVGTVLKMPFGGKGF